VVDIFDEVDEELRADRAQALLKRYGGVLIGLAVAVVVATGGWQGWRWWQAKQAREAADAYMTVLYEAEALTPQSSPANRAEVAARLEKTAAGAPAGYAALARLRAAGLRAQAGDQKAAAAPAEAVAADGPVDQVLRDYATLLVVQYGIDNGEAATEAAALQSRLQPLLNPANPWHGLAREAQAMLALRQGQTEQARQALQELVKDVTAPQGARARASALLSRVGE